MHGLDCLRRHVGTWVSGEVDNTLKIHVLSDQFLSASVKNLALDLWCAQTLVSSVQGSRCSVMHPEATRAVAMQTAVQGADDNTGSRPLSSLRALVVRLHVYICTYMASPMAHTLMVMTMNAMMYALAMSALKYQ